jgi:hypothetical protein
VVDNYFFPHLCEGSEEIDQCSFDNVDMQNLVTYYTALVRACSAARLPPTPQTSASPARICMLGVRSSTWPS